MLNAALRNAAGCRQVVITLSNEPAAAVDEGQAQIAQSAAVMAQQDRISAQIQALDPAATVLARLKVALNAMIVEVDGAQLGTIARNPEVVRINPVVNYERDLSETVPYIGATPAVQRGAFEGEDVRIAVLDSGVDYMHAKLGGPGAEALYALAYCVPAWTNVPFKAVSSYASLAPGTYNIRVVPAGSAAPVVIDANLTVEAGKDYTVAATNVLARIAPLVLADDNRAPAAGKARARFVHASPDAPAVDVAVAGGPVLFRNYAFGEASPYIEVPAGVYNLEVRLAGTTTVALALPNVTLEAGTVHSVFAMGLVADGSLSAVISADNAVAGGGVAPKAQIYAVKVCSAVSSACSGVALLQGVEFAADPDGDGDSRDHVHIINMSLGSVYGQNYFDDLSAAVDNVTALGILTVASAGNSADKPYIVGTPSAARTALSVAQTEMPSALLPILEVTAPASIAGGYPAVFQPWSARLRGVISGPVQYGNGAGGNLLGCAPFAPGSLAGRIVLVDRGACAASIKISNIAAGGALAGIIGLVAPGEPFAFGFGGGTPTVPGFAISQANANRIKAGLAAGVSMRIDPATWPPLVGTMVGSSSRGPAAGQMFYGNQVMFGQIIKPEIGAPGASISAVAGSGTGTQPFGGTSGAAPVVAGAAALLMNATDWQLSPAELKARLMNTAETTIFNTPTALGGGLAPITRIGGGEVRVDRAIAARASAWEATSGGGASRSASLTPSGPSLCCNAPLVYATTATRRSPTASNQPSATPTTRPAAP